MDYIQNHDYGFMEVPLPDSCTTPLSKFKCADCDFETTIEDMIEKHETAQCQFTSPPSENLCCSKCNLTSASKLYLTLHTRSNDQCNAAETEIDHRQTEDTNTVEPVEEIANENVNNKNVAHANNKTLNFAFKFDDKKWYKCDKCTFKTKIKICLNSHTTVAHGEPDIIKWYKCTKCKYRCKGKRTLAMHLFTKHSGASSEQIFPSNMKQQQRVNLIQSNVVQEQRSREIQSAYPFLENSDLLHTVLGTSKTGSFGADMFKTFTNKDLAIIALLLDEDQLQKRRRRVWVDPARNRDRRVGEFFTIFPQLMDDETKFYEYFQMSRDKFEILLAKTEVDLKRTNTCFRQAISPREKLAVCLRFLETGESFRNLAINYKLGQSTVHHMIYEVCETIIKNLSQEMLPIPKQADWESIADDFWNRWHFPNCLGVIGGKDIYVSTPHYTGPVYVNRKNQFCVSLLALVDVNYNFIAADVLSYKENNVGGIFGNSKIAEQFDSGILNVPEERPLPGGDQPTPFVMLGDRGFPLKRYLLRPYAKSTLTSREGSQKFNQILSDIRDVPDKAFGILTRKFRLYSRKLRMNPHHAEQVILATCILHNFLGPKNTISLAEGNPAPHKNIRDLQSHGGNSRGGSFEIRDRFARFFATEQMAQMDIT